MYYKTKCRGDNVKKQLVILLLALAITLGFSGTVTALPVHKTSMHPQVIVPISGGSYHPKVLNIKTGTTVVWVNRQRDSHTVTSVSRLFNSGLIKPGAHYRVTFTKAGIYHYYCIPHAKTMRGTVIVHR